MRAHPVRSRACPCERILHRGTSMARQRGAHPPIRAGMPLASGSMPDTTPRFVPTVPADPEAPLRAALARQRAVATGLLVAMAALMVGTYAMPPGLLDRPAAGRRQGRRGGRHRRLVRGDGAVPPAARPAHPAHRHHPGAEGAPRPGPGPLRRQPRLHRGRGAAGDGPPRPLRHPPRLPDRPRRRPPGRRGHRRHPAPRPGDAGGWPRAAAAGAPAAAHRRRAGRRRACWRACCAPWSMAAGTRRSSTLP